MYIIIIIIIMCKVASRHPTGNDLNKHSKRNPLDTSYEIISLKINMRTPLKSNVSPAA